MPNEEKKHEDAVPYERFKEVNEQNGALKAQNEQLQKLVEQYSVKPEPVPPAEPKGGLWDNPEAYVASAVDRAVSTAIEKYSLKTSSDEDLRQGKEALEKLKKIPGYSQELSVSINQYIQDHNLWAAGKANAIKAGFEAVTGKKWGDTLDDAYNTRKLKERLAPPSGGGLPTDDKVLTPEKLRDMPLEEFAKDPQKVYREFSETQAKK